MSWVGKKWIPWCTGVYTMSFCKAKVKELKAEGYITRIDHKGIHLSGAGVKESFGKIFLALDPATGETIKNG